MSFRSRRWCDTRASRDGSRPRLRRPQRRIRRHPGGPRLPARRDRLGRPDAADRRRLRRAARQQQLDVPRARPPGCVPRALRAVGRSNGHRRAAPELRGGRVRRREGSARHDIRRHAALVHARLRRRPSGSGRAPCLHAARAARRARLDDAGGAVPLRAHERGGSARRGRHPVLLRERPRPRGHRPPRRRPRSRAGAARRPPARRLRQRRRQLAGIGDDRRPARRAFPDGPALRRAIASRRRDR